MIFASLGEVGCALTISVHENTDPLARHARDLVPGKCCAKLLGMCERGSAYTGERVRSTCWLTNIVNEAMSAVQCLNADSYLTGLVSEMPSRHASVCLFTRRLRCQH
jgi:hypothetical protein